VTFAYLLALGLSVLRANNTTGLQKRIATFMLGALSVQVALGISNIVFMLPLGVAVMHNAVAAVLLLSLLYLVFTLVAPLSKQSNQFAFTSTQNDVSSHQSAPLSAAHSSFSTHALTKAPGGFHG
jgi:cytochrome c oxidase assembly protein subunit 15